MVLHPQLRRWHLEFVQTQLPKGKAPTQAAVEAALRWTECRIRGKRRTGKRKTVWRKVPRETGTMCARALWNSCYKVQLFTEGKNKEETLSSRAGKIV